MNCTPLLNTQDKQDKGGTHFNSLCASSLLLRSRLIFFSLFLFSYNISGLQPYFPLLFPTPTPLAVPRVQLKRANPGTGSWLSSSGDTSLVFSIRAHGECYASGVHEHLQYTSLCTHTYTHFTQLKIKSHKWILFFYGFSEKTFRSFISGFVMIRR